MFYSDYGKEVYYTPLAQGMHLPYSIFEYMDENFFDWICHTPRDGTDSNFDVNAYMILDRCECKGRNYFGMPNFDIKFQGYGDSDDLYYYMFEPAVFELFPKVDSLTRTTYCDLSLWNIADRFQNTTHTSRAKH